MLSLSHMLSSGPAFGAGERGALCACLAHIRPHTQTHTQFARQFAAASQPANSSSPFIQFRGSSFAGSHWEALYPPSWLAPVRPHVFTTQMDDRLGRGRLNRRLSGTFLPSASSSSLNRCISASSRAARCRRVPGDGIAQASIQAACSPGRTSNRAGESCELPSRAPPSILVPPRLINANSNEKQTHNGRRTHSGRVYCSRRYDDFYRP